MSPKEKRTKPKPKVEQKPVVAGSEGSSQKAEAQARRAQSETAKKAIEQKREKIKQNKKSIIAQAVNAEKLSDQAVAVVSQLADYYPPEDQRSLAKPVAEEVYKRYADEDLSPQESTKLLLQFRSAYAAARSEVAVFDEKIAQIKTEANLSANEITEIVKEAGSDTRSYDFSEVEKEIEGATNEQVTKELDNSIQILAQSVEPEEPQKVIDKYKQAKEGRVEEIIPEPEKPEAVPVKEIVGEPTVVTPEEPQTTAEEPVSEIEEPSEEIQVIQERVKVVGADMPKKPKSESVENILQEPPEKNPNERLENTRKALQDKIKNATPEQLKDPNFWDNTLRLFVEKTGPREVHVKGEVVYEGEAESKLKLRERITEALKDRHSEITRRVSENKERENLQRNKEPFRRELQNQRKSLQEEPYTPHKASKIKRRLQVEVAPGTPITKAPLEHVMNLPISDKTYNRLIKPLVEAERLGVNYQDLYLDVAKTLRSLAVFRNLDAQEALDIITHFAALPTNTRAQISEYQTLIEDILTYTVTSDAREPMVKRTQDQLVSDKTHVTSKGQKAANEVLDNAWGNVKQQLKAERDEKLLDIDKLTSPHAKIEARKLNERMLKDKSLLNKPNELEKIRIEIGKRTDQFTNEDIENMISFFGTKEMLFDEFSAMPASVREQYKKIIEKSKKAYQKYYAISEKLREPVSVVDSSGAIVSITPADDPKIEKLIRDVIELFKFEDPNLSTYAGDVEDLLNSVQATYRDPTKKSPELRHIADIIEEYREIFKVIRDRGEIDRIIKALDIEPQLAHVGIRDAELAKCYEFALNPEKFLAELKSKSTPEVEAFIKQFDDNVKRFTHEMLRVAGSDYERFFNDLFTSFYHENIFNNFVAGLNSLSLEIKKLEEAHEIPNISNREIKRFNYQTGEYFIDKKPLSESILRLKSYVINEREIARYHHDAYSLTLHRAPLESYAKYAEAINTKMIQTMLEDNPELESAIRYHMSFIRRRQGFDSNWKSPEGSMYLVDPATGTIPVDQYVIEQLKNHIVIVPKVELTPDGKTQVRELTEQNLEPWERERLASLARGFVLFDNLEALDTMASGGPGARVRAFTLNFFGPLQEINRMRFNEFRWGTNIFGKHEMWYYAPPGEEASDTFSIGKAIRKLNGAKGWDPLELEYKAIQLRRIRENREPPRIVTETMMREGIPIIEDDKLFGTIGLKSRFGWRIQMYEHLYQGLDSSKPTDRVQIIAKLMTSDLYAANALLEEDWYAKKIIKRDERIKLRTIVLRRLRDIAPQEFLILENKLARHAELASYSSEQITSLISDTEVVTNYLLSKSVGSEAPTISNITPENWESLFSDGKRRNEVREFITRVQRVANSAIEGTTDITLPEDNKPMAPWKECARIRSFPTHLEVKRNAKWEVMGQSFVARLFGDADRLGKAFGKYIDGARAVISEYNMHPHKARAEEFDSYHKIVEEVHRAYDSVHGLSHGASYKASSYAIGFKLEMIGFKTFQKATAARIPLGVGSLAGKFYKHSSWSHYSTGRADVLQLDESNARVWANGAERRGNIAPSHGWVEDKNDIEKGMWISIPFSGSIKKFLGKDDRRIRLIKLPFGYTAKRTKSHWNGSLFRTEAGARNWQVLLDMSRTGIPLILGLIGIAGFTTAAKEDQEKR